MTTADHVTTSTPSFFSSNLWRNKRFLVSPFWDATLAGGAALVYLAIVLSTSPFIRDSHQRIDNNIHFKVAALFALLAYVVNYPHFMASYGILYRNFRGQLRQFAATDRVMWWRFVNAGIIVPTLMGLGFCYGWLAHTKDAFGWGIVAMFFFVGWHYVKQSFGIMMVLSSVRHITYTNRERFLMYINAHVVWMYSWLNAYKVIPGLGTDTAGHSDFTYTGSSLRIPEYMATFLDWFLYTYLILTCLMLAHKWLRGQKPPLAALLGYFSMYILLLFGLSNPLWAAAAPFFHSAQYLLFIYSVKRGENLENLNIHGHGLAPHLRQLGLLYASALAFLGLLFFDFIPNKIAFYDINIAPLDWKTPWPLMFILFINIHHYFIDNVIWKRGNHEIWHHLFYGLREQQPNTTKKPKKTHKMTA